MVDFKIQNILFDGSAAFSNYPTLLIRRSGDGRVFRDEKTSFVLQGPDSFDFTTYFNSLSIYKLKLYSKIDSFYVHFEYKGSSFSIVHTSASALDWVPVKHRDTQTDYSESSEWSSLDIQLLPDDLDILASVCIETSGSLAIRNAYFYTKIEEGLLHPIELSLVSTTFRKESYVLHNLDLIKNQILDTDEPISNHLNVHIIDNGRTLDSNKLNCSRVTIHPNPNVGGSGGFARGMIESLEQNPKATHVLLMDDDVEVLPESFIRTYNLLALLKDEYSEAFLSGAMMSLEQPDLRTEDLGFFTSDGHFRPLKPEGHMSDLHDVILTETFSPRTGIWPDTAQQYAGWWYCVIPKTIIEREGLPLPLFVRGDDSEYSLRVKPKFMTMNGICVWHNSFFFKYSAAVERYQVSRNTLVAQAVTGVGKDSDFLDAIYREVQLDLKKFNYDDAALAVKGLEDFLRGPSFLEHPVAEGRFMDANREREKLVPLEDLRDEALKFGIDVLRLTADDITVDPPRSSLEAAKDFVTFNGQRLISSNGRNGRVAVIDAAGWVYPAGKIRDVDTIIAIDMPNKKGVIRHLDQKRFDEVWGRWKKASSEFKKRRASLYDEYASYREKFTSVDFWKQYLKEAFENN